MAAVTYYLNNTLYILYGSPEVTVDQLLSSSVPTDAQNVETHDDLVFPEDPLFESAWELQESTLVENITIAKTTAHDIRRARRDEEFLVWDRKVTIPAEAANAEAQRELIRQKYAQIQTDIDSAPDATTLRSVVKTFI